jgi:hypothetical protein
VDPRQPGADDRGQPLRARDDQRDGTDRPGRSNVGECHFPVEPGRRPADREDRSCPRPRPRGSRTACR